MNNVNLQLDQCRIFENNSKGKICPVQVKILDHDYTIYVGMTYNITKKTKNKYVYKESKNEYYISSRLFIRGGSKGLALSIGYDSLALRNAYYREDLTL